MIWTKQREDVSWSQTGWWLWFTIVSTPNSHWLTFLQSTVREKNNPAHYLVFSFGGLIIYLHIHSDTYLPFPYFFLSFICSYPISACCIGRDRNNRLHQKIHNFCSVRKQIVNTSWSNNSYARRSKLLKEIFFYMRWKNFKRKLISNKKKS